MWKLSQLLPCGHCAWTPKRWLWVWPSLSHTLLQSIQGRLQGPLSLLSRPCTCAMQRSLWYLPLYNLLFFIITGFKLCTWIRNGNINSQVQYLSCCILSLNVLRSGTIIKAGVVEIEEELYFFLLFWTKCNILYSHSTTVYCSELWVRQQTVKSPGFQDVWPRSESLLCWLLAVWFWVSYLICLSLSLLCCIMRLIIIHTSRCLRD